MRRRQWYYFGFVLITGLLWVFLIWSHPTVYLSLDDTVLPPEGGKIRLTARVNRRIWPVKKVWVILSAKKINLRRNIVMNEVFPVPPYTISTDSEYDADPNIGSNYLIDGQTITYTVVAFAQDSIGHLVRSASKMFIISGRKALALSNEESAFDARISIWDLLSGRQKKVLYIRHDSGDDVFVPSNNYAFVAATHGDSTIVIDFNTRKVVGRIQMAKRSLWPICFSKNSDKVIVNGAGKLWLFSSRGKLIQKLGNIEGSSGYGMVIDNLNGRIVYQLDQSRLRVFDLWDDQQFVIGGGYYGEPNDIKKWEVSADFSTAAILYHYSTPPGPNWVTVWDVEHHKEVASITSPADYDFSNHPPHENTPYFDYMSLSWNGRWLWTNGEFWNIPKKKCSSKRTIFEGPPEWDEFIISRQGKCLKKNPEYGDDSNQLDVFDLESHRLLSTISLTSGYSRRDYYFSPDDRYVCVVETLPFSELPEAP